MKSDELRRSFLDFFRARDHAIVPSMSLIPRDDPSLLFTSAGMVQFKPLWTGAIELPYRRAASVQKCLRTTDLDNVGRTRRHHTFFEMLGNFSFGDYFKEEAIAWAWEYLTEVLAIDRTRLSVSVYKDDDEAFDIWHKKIGLKKELIFRLGDEHNFWGPAGNSGPCGPCSEIFYDLGERFACGKKTCAPGCDCDRFPEVWNLVFPQFDQAVSGERRPLHNRGVDTGMGFERLVSVLQHKDTNFQTDLFLPIIEEICRHTKQRYGADHEADVAINVLADHTRALVFAIGDGIIPSNEERGYVLRRLLRRGVRLCRQLGVTEALLYKLVPGVIQLYGSAYPELGGRREEITLVIKSEEERFLDTLENGLGLLEDLFRSKKTISGADAFRLYDTYGFPLELTEEIAREKNVPVDRDGFMRMLAEAKEVSKAKAKFIPKGEWKVVQEGAGAFIGYDRVATETKILRYNEHGKTIELVLEQSPFYAEAGGQIGDQGWIEGHGFKLNVIDTYWYQSMIVCHCEVASGRFAAGDVTARVDRHARQESARAHTATHLLHAALRKTLGEHARQEGSFVEPGRFRFDFTHFKPLSDDEITVIEDLVNEKIMAAIPVEKFFTSLDEAKKMGAMAIFGEKYGEHVRVVKVGDFSLELCGGIHLDNTGEIGLLKITSQESAAAGIRRIEASVGMRLFGLLRKQYAQIQQLVQIFGSEEDLLDKVHDFQRRLRDTEKANEENSIRLAQTDAESTIRKAEEKIEAEKKRDANVKIQTLSITVTPHPAKVTAGANDPTVIIGPPVVIHNNYQEWGAEKLRATADALRHNRQQVIFFLTESICGRVQYIIAVTADLEQKFPANKLIKDISRILGGGGGGRPHLAEGGGGRPDKIPEAIAHLEKLIQT